MGTSGSSGMGGGPRRLGNETRKGADMDNKGGGSGRHVGVGGGYGEGRASGAEAVPERFWAHVRLQNEAKNRTFNRALC